MELQTALVYELGNIVAKVSAKVTPVISLSDSTITGVWYKHGHPLEIMTTLQEQDLIPVQKQQRLPLIALFQDFPINRGQLGMEGDALLHIIIAMGTKATYKAEDRQRVNFDPILYPIYQELLNQLDKSSYFLTYGPDEIQHTQIDRMYWGKQGLYGNTSNVFNDRIDAIELQNIKLKINRKFCLPKTNIN